MTANQITRQDVANLLSVAWMPELSNRDVSIDAHFIEMCKALEIDPTKRQASKFRRQTGQLWTALHTRNK